MISLTVRGVPAGLRSRVRAAVGKRPGTDGTLALAFPQSDPPRYEDALPAVQAAGLVREIVPDAEFAIEVEAKFGT